MMADSVSKFTGSKLNFISAGSALWPDWPPGRPATHYARRNAPSALGLGLVADLEGTPPPSPPSPPPANTNNIASTAARALPRPPPLTPYHVPAHGAEC
jgi:hypothetical protein